jgi:uncharacterized protein (DUF488 family)
MIYTVGYATLTPTALERLVTKLRIDLLVDARAKPWSRKPGFARGALERQLGNKYQWAGTVLGGFQQTTAVGIAMLRRLHASDQRVLVMCMEHAPGDCHRHSEIAMRLLPHIDCVHVFDNEGVLASELQRAIDRDDDYATLKL